MLYRYRYFFLYDKVAAMFSMRLVSVDYYMGSPVPGVDVEYSDFRGLEVKQVPVIRIFGSSVTGKKTCLHIHGVFPYMYIPCEDAGGGDGLVYQIASSLDKAINISLGKANSTTRHVFKMVLVSGIPFYGFHRKQHLFLKIYFYNPLMVKKATELLQKGAILNKIYQPHEAHIPYVLQFMIDYNLYGMNLVDLESIRVRRVPENTELLEAFPEDVLLPSKIPKISTCELEFDALAGDIINRRCITGDMVVNPGLSAIWNEEKQRRREEGRHSQITPQNSQERPCAVPTSTEVLYKQQLREKLLALSIQNSGSSSTNTSEPSRTPYPSETPEGLNLLNASYIDVHEFTSVKSECDVNGSVINKDLILSLSEESKTSLAGHADEDLAALLNKLEQSGDVDDDSILGSQLPEELVECIYDEAEEDIQELSQPLELLKESRFSETQNSENSDDEKLIQVDGANDPINHSGRRRRKTKLAKIIPPNSPERKFIDCKTKSSQVGEESQLAGDRTVQRSISSLAKKSCKDVEDDLIANENSAHLPNIPDLPESDAVAVSEAHLVLESFDNFYEDIGDDPLVLTAECDELSSYDNEFSSMESSLIDDPSLAIENRLSECDELASCGNGLTSTSESPSDYTTQPIQQLLLENKVNELGCTDELKSFWTSNVHFDCNNREYEDDCNSFMLTRQNPNKTEMGDEGKNKRETEERVHGDMTVCLQKEEVLVKLFDEEEDLRSEILGKKLRKLKRSRLSLSCRRKVKSRRMKKESENAGSTKNLSKLRDESSDVVRTLQPCYVRLEKLGRKSSEDRNINSKSNEEKVMPLKTEISKYLNICKTLPNDGCGKENMSSASRQLTRSYSNDVDLRTRKKVIKHEKSNLFCALKPFSITLERLDQSLLNAYKAKIPSLDGEFETSSSDDSLDIGFERKSQQEEGTSLRKQSPTKCLKRNIYPPLAVTVQKSPKRNPCKEKLRIVRKQSGASRGFAVVSCSTNSTSAPCAERSFCDNINKIEIEPLSCELLKNHNEINCNRSNTRENRNLGKFTTEMLSDVECSAKERSEETVHKQSETSSDSACAVTSNDENIGVLSFYNDTVMELPTQHLCRNAHYRIFTPRYEPPTKVEILGTLGEFNIPEHLHPKPFTSKVSDVMGKKVMGNQLLKIASNSVIDLQPFTSGLCYATIEVLRLDSLQDFLRNSQRSLELNDDISSKYTKCALASHREMVIVPCKLPPGNVEVKAWLKQKDVQEDVITERNRQIFVPLSPGQDCDSDDGMSLSISIASTPSVQSPPEENSSMKEKTPMQRTRRRLKLGSQETAVELKCETILPEKILKTEETPMETPEGNKSFQLGKTTPNSSYGFRMSLGNLQNTRAVCEHQYLTTLIMELHFHTRGDLKPDPEYDPIRALFYVVINDVPEDMEVENLEKGVIVVGVLDGNVKIPALGETSHSCKLTYVDDEASLVLEFVSRVKRWDPDILAGYEIEMLSWGYIVQRAFRLEMNLCTLISRIPKENSGNESLGELKVPGRIVLNFWRLLRHEVALQSYTFENVMYHVLHQRIPLHTYKQLTFWWEHKTHLYRWICVDYYLLRVVGIVKLVEQLDLIGRTSELARLFGIQFLEVLSRGSQFRVESMMLRLAKPLNYVSLSPSIKQRAKMRAPETLPLIMEPNSRYYADPVIVLDFQSLYPSIIIAYNYCFSTCLGRTEHLGQCFPFAFGCAQLKISPVQVLRLMNDINISPCGVAFVKEGVRKGILPRMLEEILDTRLMVKQSMKECKSNSTLQRILHSRQLGLKLIANVTYGYTAAHYSGRMPCTEVGDSVVSKGRETLERAIRLVEATSRWKAQVVYGDTDSLFVLVPGRSRKDAFKIGAEIAQAVTQDNPKPVKLKLEKVYQPCILQTKKRYVGYKYESLEQTKPVYEAKGIETVRRDGCPAVAKILEKSLRLLFETQDMSTVKSYVCQQFTKILQGRLNLQDLIFAREYRGMSGYRPGACVPALELARSWLQTDKRAEPRQNERVPYVIVNGPPNIPLIRLVRSPHELLADPSLRPNVSYYITRVIIPPLDRCFCLLGADITSWYNEMPRKLTGSAAAFMASGPNRNTISQHFATMACAVCAQLTTAGLCCHCQQQPQNSCVALASKIHMLERSFANVTKVCQSCCGHGGKIDCVSLDCPVLFRRNQITCDLRQVSYIRQLQDQYVSFR